MGYRKTKTPVDTTTANLTQATPFYALEVDETGNILQGKAVSLFDPVTGRAETTTLTSTQTTFGNTYAKTIAAFQVLAKQDTGFFEYSRTPGTFKTASVAAAPATTDVWSPTAGKKFRLMGGVITMGGTIAAAAARTLQLIEETAGTVIIEVHMVIPVLGGNVQVPFTIPGNGYLSSAVTKKLQAVTAGGTYVVGTDAVSVWGTEE